MKGDSGLCKLALMMVVKTLLFVLQFSGQAFVLQFKHSAFVPPVWVGQHSLLFILLLHNVFLGPHS